MGRRVGVISKALPTAARLEVESNCHHEGKTLFPSFLHQIVPILPSPGKSRNRMNHQGSSCAIKLETDSILTKPNRTISDSTAADEGRLPNWPAQFVTAESLSQSVSPAAADNCQAGERRAGKQTDPLSYPVPPPPPPRFARSGEAPLAK